MPRQGGKDACALIKYANLQPGALGYSVVSDLTRYVIPQGAQECYEAKRTDMLIRNVRRRFFTQDCLHL